MSFVALSASFIAEKKAIINALWAQIAANFLDHNARLNALESSPTAPTGAIVPYGNVAPPSGWLLCDGSVVSQTTYAALYAVLSTSYNTGGEGGGNFRLPNSLGRTPIGSGTGSGLTARTVGGTTGVETHPLVTGEMATHAHGLTDPGHTHAGVKRKTSGGGSTLSHRIYGPASVISPVTFITNSNTTGVTLANNGSGTAHQNMQPFLVMPYIVKT